MSREELARDIYAADNWRDPFAYDEWPKLAEHNQEYTYAIADGLIASGYRKPRTITTAEELDKLPVGTVVCMVGADDCRPRVAVKSWESQKPMQGYHSTWEIADCNEFDAGTDELDDLPATVLWEPLP